MPVSRIERIDGTDRGSVMRKGGRDTGTRGPDGKNIIKTGGGGGVLQIWRSPDSMVVVAGNSICKFVRLL